MAPLLRADPLYHIDTWETSARTHAGPTPRGAYRLTRSGEELGATLDDVGRWAIRWLSRTATPDPHA